MSVDKMKALEFIEKICELSKEMGLSLGHEDAQGGFLVHEYDKASIEWLRQASACKKGER